MLFGNTPPQRPRGLFGAFAPNMQGMPLEPIQQAMTRPVAPEQADQMQAMMGASMDKKPGFFAEGGIGRMIAGGLGDVLLQRTGGQPIYQQHMMQQQALKQRQQMMQQQREADWQDFQRQFDYKAEWEKNNPDPGKPDILTRMMVGAGIDPNSEQGRQYYAKRAQILTSPMQLVPDGFGGVRPVQVYGGGDEEGPVGDFGPVVDQLPGGVGGNTGGGFPVTGGKLDSVTARNESGNRDYYSNGAAVVSPKGAKFAMQVLPSTAQDPGFGLRPANPNDPADMNRLGREYRAKMEARYKGNLPLMWAAYNAGPGRIDNLLAKYGQSWLQYAPKETQDYVARNMRAVRGN